MIRTIIWAVLAALELLIYFPAVLIAWFFRDKEYGAGASPVPVFFVKLFAPLMARLAGVTVERTGEENLPDKNVPAMFAGNHQGNFDALIALMYLGEMKPLLIKSQLKKLPVANLYMDLLGCVPIDRQDIRQSLTALKKISAKLENGHSVVIFPEGTRSKGPEMGEFKPGAFKPAVKNKALIVPFAIDGSYKCLEEKGKLAKATIKVSILPSITPEEYEGMNTTEISELVKTRISEELRRMR